MRNKITPDNLLRQILYCSKNRLITISNEDYDKVLNKIERYLKEKENEEKINKHKNIYINFKIS